MRPKKITDTDMLRCTRDCILRFGVSVSTQTIADELGVSQATLFKRFGTKDTLIQKALLQPIVEHRIFDDLQSLSTQKNVVSGLSSLCFSLLSFFEDTLPSIMMLRSTGCDVPSILRSKNAPPMVMRRKLTEWFDRLQQTGHIRQTSSENLALAMIGAVQHRAFRLHILLESNLADDNEQFVSSIVDVFWQGISPGKSR